MNLQYFVFVVTMISEVFNANPTIYAKSKRSLRKSRFQTGQSLWVDVDVQQDQWSDTSDVEPIDQDEIFGENVKLHMFERYSMNLLILKISYGRSLIQSIPPASKNFGLYQQNR